MLIVCPNCATSYMIDPASVGQTGRSVRCARCKTTWFAGGPKSAPAVTAFVDGVIAEAQAQSGGESSPPPKLPPARSFDMPSPYASANEPEPDHAPKPGAGDDFGVEPPEPQDQPSPTGSGADDIWPAAATPADLDAGRGPHAADTLEHLSAHDAPSLVPPIEHEPLPSAGSAEVEAEDRESFVARRQRLKKKRDKSRKSSHWTAIVLVLFAFNVALVGARHEVVRYLPQTASLFAAIGLPVNLRNLSFENVRITKQTQDGVDILVVEGHIVSTANKAVEVPRLRFAARNAAGQEVYTWTMLPSRSVLGPDERLDFRSTLAAPPADANDVMVRFFNETDAAAAGK
ncbi:MAG: zinc-ribbon domain-containing protein [Pseudolabrys sp.]|nr:zinc-ribbon domain-containing protein [Pseudolabrys sp.]